LGFSLTGRSEATPPGLAKQLSQMSSYQNIPPPPARQPSEAAPSQPPPGGAPPPDGGGALGLLPLLIMVVPLLLLMFFTSRSQQKKQTQMLASLKKGDRVLIQGGMVGKLVELGDRYAKVELAPGVKVDVLKSGLLGKDTAETAAAVEKK
jgi:preprotein translocase subunit YajC